MSRARSPADPTAPRTAWPSVAAWRWGGAALLLAAVGVTWANSLHTPFLFDDQSAILRNASIRSFATALFPPSDVAGVPNRPLVNLSLALNHAVGGANVRGYHLFNVALHAANALLLFAFLRRTIRRLAVMPVPSLALGATRVDHPSLAPGATPADLAALAIALLWAVHPLQTESVTFVIQRTELLGACFTLVALLAFARALECHLINDIRGRTWTTVSVVACLLGAFSKETIAVVPLLALLYDRTFFADSFAAAWRARWRTYLGMAMSWLILAAYILHTPNRGGSVGFASGVSAWEYLLTQAKALVTYLKLSLWPHPLVVDYGDRVVGGLGEVWGQGSVVLALLGATGWAWVRRPVWGFVGAWFFVILAPSSSIVPLATQTVAEHRMYLPLAAVLTVLVFGLARCGARVLATATVLGAAAFMTVSVHRNADYASAVRIWAHTARHAPGNYRAHYNLGNALVAEGRTAEAVASYERAVRLRPELGTIHFNLGSVLAELGRTAEAIPRLEEAIRLGPDSVDARANLGAALARSGRLEEAIGHYARATELDPTAADLWVSLGELRLMQGDRAGALREYEEALRVAPGARGLRERVEALRRPPGR